MNKIQEILKNTYYQLRDELGVDKLAISVNLEHDGYMAVIDHDMSKLIIRRLTLSDLECLGISIIGDRAFVSYQNESVKVNKPIPLYF